MLLITTLVVLATSAIYLFIHRKYGYWKKKNIPHIKPLPVVGNFADHIFVKKSMSIVEQDICKKFENEPLVGAYFGTEPCLIVQDPRYIKIVTTKDFYYFSSREISDYVHKDLLTKKLFNTYGDEWRVLRQNFSPVFTSSKMKHMFTMIEKLARTFESLLDKEIGSANDLEVRTLFGRFTTDCIGACAFGLNPGAMQNYTEDNPFRNVNDSIFHFTLDRFLRRTARAVWPGLFYGIGLNVNPKEIGLFFSTLMSKIFKERRLNKEIIRNDFIDFVLHFSNQKYLTGDSIKNLKSGGKDKISLTVNDEMMAAQCFIFFTAGHETTAITEICSCIIIQRYSSYTLYELAKDQKSQDGARAEVDEFLKKHNGVLNYDCVTELPFLEQCVDEALRLYPVLGVITREVVEPYTFPDTNLTVDRGMRIHLPVQRVHRNPKYFKDPDTFNPERFSPEEKKNIVPSSYFPFGEGPRICIGMRFAKMQMLAGLVTILKKYRFELADGMSKQIEFEPKSLLTHSKHEIKLKFTPRTDSQPIMFAA